MKPNKLQRIHSVHDSSEMTGISNSDNDDPSSCSQGHLETKPSPVSKVFKLRIGGVKNLS